MAELTNNELADAARAFERLRELGSSESLASLVERFARRRAAALERAKKSGRAASKEPEFLFPDAVRRLLREFGRRPGQLEDAVGVQLAVGFFAGLTGTETRMLRWSDIDLGRGVLAVRRRTKTGETLDRMVDLEPNAVLWLEKIRNWSRWKSGRRLTDGPIVQAQDGFGDWLRIAFLTWEKDWTEPAFRMLMRNTYATMHLAAFADAASTALFLGHKDAGDLLAYHYGDLVPQGVAREFWSLTPARSRLPQTPFERREEARAAARKEWDERWMSEEKQASEARRTLPTAEVVKRIFQAVERNPGTLEAAPGAALTLGFFVGARNAEIARARWEDFDPERGTMTFQIPSYGPHDKKMPASISVTLREPALLWLLRWRAWATSDGRAAEGPIVPMYDRFRSWAERFLIGRGILRTFPADLMAKTYRAMKTPGVDATDFDGPSAVAASSEQEAYWSILPPHRVRPSLPRSRPRRHLRPKPATARGKAATRTKPLPVSTVRRIFACVADNPGPREAAVGATFTLGFLAGLKTVEIHKARWEDVDWARGTITIPEPEGHRDTRCNEVVELHATALDWLRRWHDWASADGRPATGLVVRDYWRFMHWRRGEKRLARLKWANDLMCVTYKAHRNDPAYFRIRCRGEVREPARLLGRGFRTDLSYRASDFVGPPDLRKHNPRWRILGTDTVERVFRAAEAHPGDLPCAAGAFLTLGFFVGLRTSEIARARWEDIDWNAAAIVIPKPRKYIKGAVAPKVLPLRPNALAWLRRWEEWARENGASPGGPIAPSPWRFLEWKKSHLAASAAAWCERGQHDVMRLTCETMARVAGFEDVPPEQPDGRPSTDFATKEEADAFWRILPSSDPYPPAEILRWHPRKGKSSP